MILPRQAGKDLGCEPFYRVNSPNSQRLGGNNKDMGNIKGSQTNRVLPI
jgi:hypothetical protein